MKNSIIFTVFLIVWTVIKLCFKLLGALVQVLASLIIFFGLYIPLFYGVFGIVLMSVTDFTLGPMGTDQILYFAGLGLCGVASLIISIRNLIVRPLSSVFEPLVDYREEVRRKREEKRMKKEDLNDDESDRPYRDQRGYDPYYGQRGYEPYGAPQYPPQYPYAPRRPYDGRDPYYEEGGYRDDEQSGAPYYREPYPRPEMPAPRPEVGFASASERPLIYYSKRRPGILVKEYPDRFELFDETDGRRYIGTEYKDE